MKLQTLLVDSLKEHPKNREYFQDISGEFWKIFLEDIRENGIKEPLTVNQSNMHVIKGNQRLRAARELGITEVPCLLVKIDTEDIEIEELIRDNVLRRDIDVFTKFTLVNTLRERVKGRQAGRPSKENPAQNGPDLKPRDKIAEIINVSKGFVSMADLYNSFPAEKQTELREWFYKQEVEPTQKSLKEKLDDIAGKNDTLNKMVMERDETISEQSIKIKDLTNFIQQKEIKIQELTGQVGKEQSLKKLKEDIDKLKATRNTLSEEMDVIKELVRIQHDARDLIKKLSPVKYSRIFSSDGISPVVRKTITEIMDEVGMWVADIADILNKTKNVVKVK